MTPKEEGYYKINKTKRILYWDGEKWLKPVKDQQKTFLGGWLTRLDEQPTKIKSIESVDIRKI